MPNNIPNLLTLFRILLIPVFVLIFYLPVSWNHVVAAGIFAFAAVTDWLDGWAARSLKQTSALGAFLDPVADKLIIAVALVMIVGEQSVPFLTIPAAIIVSREIVVSALREWMAELGRRAHVAVSRIGKIKTIVQMISVIILLAYKPGENLLVAISGGLLLYLAVALTLWSMMIYIKAAWTNLRE